MSKSWGKESRKKSSGLGLTKEQLAVLRTPWGLARSTLGLDLYPWQEDILKAVYQPDSRVSARGANGVGKTREVITPLILWHLLAFPRGIVVSTAGVKRQVQDVLGSYLKQYEPVFAPIGWKFGQGHISTPQGGFYRGFTTDDPGKFESWHGTEEVPLMMIYDEAKTVPDMMIQAMDRCQPQRALLISSTSFAEGEFYASHTKRAKFFQTFQIKADMCPHISPQTIADMREKWGGYPEFLASLLDAEFINAGENCILTLGEFDKCMMFSPRFNDNGDISGACDFAAGGDQNVFAVRNGNKVKIVRAWRNPNPIESIGEFIELFVKSGLKPNEIVGDADGMGKVIVDGLRNSGWPILPFHGGGAADDDHYKNRISEVWRVGCEMVKRRELIFEASDEPTLNDLKGQLTSRRTKHDARGKLWIESKEDMRKRGLPSPDLADACLMAAMPNRYSGGFNLFNRNSSQQLMEKGWSEQGESEWSDEVTAGMRCF